MKKLGNTDQCFPYTGLFTIMVCRALLCLENLDASQHLKNSVPGWKREAFALRSTTLLCGFPFTYSNKADFKGLTIFFFGGGGCVGRIRGKAG